MYIDWENSWSKDPTWTISTGLFRIEFGFERCSRFEFGLGELRQVSHDRLLVYARVDDLFRSDHLEKHNHTVMDAVNMKHSMHNAFTTGTITLKYIHYHQWGGFRVLELQCADCVKTVTVGNSICVKSIECNFKKLSKIYNERRKKKNKRKNLCNTVNSQISHGLQIKQRSSLLPPT